MRWLQVCVAVRGLCTSYTWRSALCHLTCWATAQVIISGCSTNFTSAARGWSPHRHPFTKHYCWLGQTLRFESQNLIPTFNFICLSKTSLYWILICLAWKCTHFKHVVQWVLTNIITRAKAPNTSSLPSPRSRWLTHPGSSLWFQTTTDLFPSLSPVLPRLLLEQGHWSLVHVSWSACFWDSCCYRCFCHSSFLMGEFCLTIWVSND